MVGCLDALELSVRSGVNSFDGKMLWLGHKCEFSIVDLLTTTVLYLKMQRCLDLRRTVSH